jgi:UDP-N-acetylmuramoylalanine--D-glutamate ligase
MKSTGHDNYFILGLARSGCAAALLLAGREKTAVVYDDSAAAIEAFMSSDQADGYRDRLMPADPKLAEQLLKQSAGLVVSPGVPLDHRRVTTARQLGLEVIGELELAGRFCTAGMVGVTGTNGKSTVVNIIGGILSLAGIANVVAGNVGTPFSSVIEQANSGQVVVLEISSFQLDTIRDFKADVAVLLNVTPDHLDRYEDSMEKYAESKSRILNRADDDTLFVYNLEDEICRRIAAGFNGPKIPFSSARVLDEGVYLEDGVFVRQWNGRRDEFIARQEFTPVGIHNAENALAALAAVTPYGIEPAQVNEALKKYHALPHRMELVRVLGGVAYINDSKATNVDAAMKSLQSIEGRVILIIGGKDKNGDFSTLIPHLGRVLEIITIGEAAGKIESVLVDQRPLQRAGSLEEAVSAAEKIAQPGDTVLLAPACASFDMFTDYKHRGDVFRASVSAL